MRYYRTAALARIIRERRHALKLSIPQAAEICESSPENLARLEGVHRDARSRARRGVRRTTLEAISKGLDIDWERLAEAALHPDWSATNEDTDTAPSRPVLAGVSGQLPSATQSQPQRGPDPYTTLIRAFAEMPTDHQGAVLALVVDLARITRASSPT